MIIKILPGRSDPSNKSQRLLMKLEMICLMPKPMPTDRPPAKATRAVPLMPMYYATPITPIAITQQRRITSSALRPWGFMPKKLPPSYETKAAGRLARAITM